MLLNLKVFHPCDLTYTGNTSGAGRWIVEDFQSTPVVITYGSLNLLSVVNFRNNCESVEFDYHRDADVFMENDGRERASVREREKCNRMHLEFVCGAIATAASRSRCERSVCQARNLCFVSSSHVELLYCNGKTFRRSCLSFVAFSSRRMNTAISVKRETDSERKKLNREKSESKE